MNDRNEETDDDGAVREESERNERVTSSETFPQTESDDRNSTANEKRDAVTVRPVRPFPVGDGDGDKDHTETGDEEKETDEVELPEYGEELLLERASRDLLGSELRFELLSDLLQHWESAFCKSVRGTENSARGNLPNDELTRDLAPSSICAYRDRE